MDGTGRGGAPKYAQIAAVLRAEILAGRLAPGDRVPGEREITDTYDVSKTTAAEVLRMLAAEGLVTRRTGVGSFVADDIQRAEVQVIEVPPGTMITARPALTACGAELVIEEPGAAPRVLDAGRAVVIAR
jgi:DNA-binding GntR family transcriptional regulator